MAKSHFEVVRVMCRRNFHHAGAKFHVDVAVRHHRDAAADQRENQRLPDKCLVALVVRMDRDGGVAEHRFRTRRRELQIARAILKRVAQMPEEAVLFLKLDFCVGNRRLAVRAPVDNALAAVDQPLLVEADEHLAHGLAAALVERKALALPVAGNAQLFELFLNAPAILFFPCPGALQKCLAADLLFCNALLPHGFHNLCLRRNGRVVRAGHPKGVIPLHTAPANQDVLQRFVECMAHMQLASDIRRRHDNGIWFLGFVPVGVEIAALHPKRIDTVLHLAGVVRFCKLSAHEVYPPILTAGRKKAPALKKPVLCCTYFLKAGANSSKIRGTTRIQLFCSKQKVQKKPFVAE